MRLKARVDENQPRIVKLFRRLGCTVVCTHAVGKGMTDIVVGKYGVNVLVEIKDGEKVPSKRKLTPDEADFHQDWQGWVSIIETDDDAIALEREMMRVAQDGCLP